MNLTAMKDTLNSVLKELKNVKAEYPQGTDIARVSGADRLTVAYSILERTGLFKDLLSVLSKSTLIGTALETVTLKASMSRVYMASINNLLQTINAMVEMINYVVPNTPENTLFIKIVEPSDIKSLEKNIAPYQKIIGQVVIHPSIEGKADFVGVEPGSTFIKICVGTIIAVKLIAGIAWASSIVSKKNKEIELLDEQINAQKLANENTKNMISGSKAMTEMVITIEARNLYRKFYAAEGEFDNEQIERLKMSIKLFSEEIDRGAKIYPSLNAPEDVKNLFPEIKELPAINFTKRIDKEAHKQ